MSRTNQKKSTVSTFTKVTVATVAVFVLAVTAVIVVANLNRHNASTSAPDPGPTGSLPGTRANSHVLDEVGADAPTLVEFLDFECEACGAFYPIVEQLREDYKGQINYVIRYFPIPSHFNAMNAAIAVEAAAQQGRVEDMYHKMYETQTTWSEQQVSKADLFRTFAEELGLDMAAYDAAVADPATQQRVEADMNEGRQMGVEGTPTFFLDGQKIELTQAGDLAAAIERALNS